MYSKVLIIPQFWYLTNNLMKYLKPLLRNSESMFRKFSGCIFKVFKLTHIEPYVRHSPFTLLLRKPTLFLSSLSCLRYLCVLDHDAQHHIRHEHLDTFVYLHYLLTPINLHKSNILLDLSILEVQVMERLGQVLYSYLTMCRFFLMP